jgi:upstream activation factor subunit UAF30
MSDPGQVNELFGPASRLTMSFPTPFPEEYMPTKTTDGKAGAKKAAAKPAAKKASGGSKPNALQQPLQPSKELAVIVGSNPLPRGEVVSKMWEYIKKNNLQNPENKREILADDKLQPIFGKPKVTMFEMNKHLAQHLK